MTSVILVNTWIGIGFHMTVFFAAISGISESILDANRLDGVRGIAGPLVNMTIPLTWNALRIAIVIAVTQSLRAFDLVFVMTEGGGTQWAHAGPGNPAVPGILSLPAIRRRFHHRALYFAAEPCDYPFELTPVEAGKCRILD